MIVEVSFFDRSDSYSGQTLNYNERTVRVEATSVDDPLIPFKIREQGMNVEKIKRVTEIKQHGKL